MLIINFVGLGDIEIGLENGKYWVEDINEGYIEFLVFMF